VFLLIDSSTDQGLLALIERNEIRRELVLPIGQKNSSGLMPMLERLFLEEKIRVEDLTFIAVGVGPGSYTGIRVGLVVAKMVSFSAKKPLVGVPSLTAFFPDADGPFTAVLDARIAGAYALRGKKERGEIVWEEPFVAPLSTLQMEPLLVTPHRQLQEKLPGNYYFTPPRAKFMAEAAGALYNQGSFDVKVLYLRPTQAELNYSQ